MLSKTDQAGLVANLFESFRQQYGERNVALLETHISYVLLNGQHAYKIKKAIKLDFLDFSTLDRRRHYCEEELRLNRRYAPHLYLDVVAIGGSVAAPRIESPGPAIEYAVKMREFPQTWVAENLMASGDLHDNQIEQLALKLASFHAECRKATHDCAYGSGDSVLQTARDNFPDIRGLLSESADLADLAQIEQWTETEFSALSSLFAERKAEGFVRECHGDLHLGNLVLIDGEMSFFDCIEFNEEFRWIDVMSEVAFLVMDLDAHRAADFAFLFLNAYLQETGDYAGLALLRFYVVYRAMVRAKVALLQLNGKDGQEAMAKYRSYVHLVKRWMQAPAIGMILMHGLSGSGKSRLSRRLLQMASAIRLRSDVERKRLVQLPPSADSRSSIDADLYDSAMTEATYRRLLFLTQAIVRAGYTIIVDATFLKCWQRKMFSDWAGAAAVPCAILCVTASPEVLRERVARRVRKGGDASEADMRVLEHQLQTEEPLDADEAAAALVYDSTQAFDADDNAAAVGELLARLEKPLQGLR